MKLPTHYTDSERRDIALFAAQPAPEHGPAAHAAYQRVRQEHGPQRDIYSTFMRHYYLPTINLAAKATDRHNLIQTHIKEARAEK